MKIYFLQRQQGHFGCELTCYADLAAGEQNHVFVIQRVY